jgi:hypothetical protein
VESTYRGLSVLDAGTPFTAWAPRSRPRIFCAIRHSSRQRISRPGFFPACGPPRVWLLS